MRIRPEKMLEYVDYPQFGSKDGEYGKWGILNLEQRIVIKELCEYTIKLEKLMDRLIKELIEAKKIEMKGDK